MDDEEGLPIFNFEQFEDSTDDPAGGAPSGRRVRVCHFWLRDLCMKGDACDFLHQYDQSRFQVCNNFQRHGHCLDRHCVLKHSVEDIKECDMFKFGFCPNGKSCQYRHVKLPGSPPPVEEVLKKLQSMNTPNYGNSSETNQQWNAGDTQQMGNPQLSQGHNNQGGVVKSSTTDFSYRHQYQQQVQLSQQQQVGLVPIQNMSDGPPNQANTISTPLPQGKSRYFMVKSYNYKNLKSSVRQGVWATHSSNEAKLNEAFDSKENVILIFSVNQSKHIQGCAKMASKICWYSEGEIWKHASGTARYGRNFYVTWLKLCELPFHKTNHLMNPYEGNQPVKNSRDCTQLEPSVGEQLASLLYLEPDSELMVIAVASEMKRGWSYTVGFDHYEEESDEEDNSSMVAAVQGRGRGKEIMRPQHMPMGRGVRPNPGMLPAYPPEMMGAGGVAPHGFGAPYGPRYYGDFRGPAPGMMFYGRPFQPAGGFGMMMGPRHGPFLGASSSNIGWAAIPQGMPMFPLPPPPPQSYWNYNDNNRAPLLEAEAEAGNDNEAESEDEAPLGPPQW